MRNYSCNRLNNAIRLMGEKAFLLVYTEKHFAYLTQVSEESTAIASISILADFGSLTTWNAALAGKGSLKTSEYI